MGISVIVNIEQNLDITNMRLVHRNILIIHEHLTDIDDIIRSQKAFRLSLVFFFESKQQRCSEGEEKEVREIVNDRRVRFEEESN